jgi:hypothetical protein
MNYHEKIIVDIELHSVEGIEECFRHGVSPNDLHNKEALIYELISEYTRSPRFRECVKVFVDHGLRFEDRPLLLVLLDDAPVLEETIRSNLSILQKKIFASLRLHANERS